MMKKQKTVLQLKKFSIASLNRYLVIGGDDTEETIPPVCTGTETVTTSIDVPCTPRKALGISESKDVC